jgi:hypothetical protein
MNAGVLPGFAGTVHRDNIQSRAGARGDWSELHASLTAASDTCTPTREPRSHRSSRLPAPPTGELDDAPRAALAAAHPDR